MRKKRISALLIALVVVVGIPSSTFAATIGGTEAVAGPGQIVTSQVSNEVITTTGSDVSVKQETATVEQPGSIEENGNTVVNDDSKEQNKDTVKDESGNLPNTEEPAVEKPVVEAPTVEEPVVTEPAIEEPKAEEPAVEEPVVNPPAEEPVATEPAIVVEEPVVTEPAVVVEEPTVTEPAIVVEPVPAKLTVTHILKLDTGDVRHTETIEGIELGSSYDISALINETEEVKCVSDIRNVQMDELEKVVVLEYEIVKKELATEDSQDGSLND